MTCEWDSQATSDCSYHMCEFFLFYTFPSNELFFTFTQEKIVPDAKSGSLMGRQSCWCSGKALKAVKLALKDCKTSFLLFSLLFFLLPRQVFFTQHSQQTERYFLMWGGKKSAIIETWNFLKAKKTKLQLGKYLQSHAYVSCAAPVVVVAAVQLHPTQAGLLKKMRNPMFDYTKFRLWKWYPQKPHSLKSLCLLLYRQLIHAIFFIGFPWSYQYLQTAIPPSFFDCKC